MTRHLRHDDHGLHVRFFRTNEVGQDGIVGPAGVSELSPVIVKLGLSADVEETVNGARFT